LRYAGRGGLVLGAVAVCALGMEAATTGWQQSAGSFFYDDTANWVGGVINNTFHSSLTLTGPLTVSLAHDYTTTGDLLFNHHAAGRDIALGGAAVLTLGGDLHYTPQDTAGAQPALNIAPELTLNLGGVSRVFDAGGSAIASKISVPGSILATGSAGLNVTGIGSVSLGGVNTLPGGLTANGGRVILTRNEAAGTQPLTVTGGGLAGFLGANMTGAGAFPNAVVINGSGFLYAASTAPATLSGPVTLNGALTGSYVTLAGPVTVSAGGGQLGSSSGFVGGGGDLTVQGVIGGAGELTVASAFSSNSVYLLNANTYQGGTKLGVGKVYFSDKAAFGAGPITITGKTMLSSYLSPLTGANAIANPITVSGPAAASVPSI
jgi:fibronectin-binding autotransporter adhesin